jgi:deoxyribodipyrimidine photo-lyase
MSSSAERIEPPRGRTIVVLFNRDLRIHDQPALAAAAANAETVVPLFVLDPALLAGAHASPNRVAVLVDALHDLRVSLRRLGSTLVVRHGDPVDECMRITLAVSASAVHVTADVSAYARGRQTRLAQACAAAGVRVSCFPGVTVVPPEELRASSGDHYRVFTPYWRAWSKHPWRAAVDAPARLRLPPGIGDDRQIPAPDRLCGGARSPGLARGGETVARAAMDRWLRDGIGRYAATHDDLDDGASSRLSAALHLGCLSPLELARGGLAADGGETFVRQLCWRDFHHQVTQAFPAIAREDYRPRGRRWEDRPDLLEAWQEGRTGVPVVDAAMRQLLVEGWMPNRARLIAASYLVKTLGVDWRHGAAHFLRWLSDGDLANNSGNWQWVAGTGNDTRPKRGFNVERQARRFDPDGAYVRRYGAALSGVALRE